MPKYAYIKLRVMCRVPRDFKITELRAAVEYLRAVPGVEDPVCLAGLIADAGTVRAGEYKLGATPMLYLREIVGRTPSEIWAAYDAKIDDSVESVVKRSGGFKP